MKTLLTRLILENWQRKLLSLILAMIIWMVVSHSMTTTKVVHNVPVRITNLPPEKTIEGMQTNNLLSKRVSLTLTGNKNFMEELSGKDLEVVIDAAGKPSEWIAVISKINLVSLNPSFEISKSISRLAPLEMILRQSNLVTEKIPVVITQPIGEAPKGYQFLDIWPYQLSLTVNGPEEAVKKLKSRGLKLTFNLNDISKTELDALQASKKQGQSEELSYLVPAAWKKISLPLISETPIEIDDPLAATLRIDFSRQDLLPIGVPLPISVFFPQKYSDTLNPETYSIATSDFIVKKNGIKMVQAPLFAKGVSHRFLEIVKDMIQIVVIAAPKSEREKLIWNAQFMYPHELEDRYVAKAMSEANDELSDVQPHLRENYLRNRFRNYMNRFRLYTPDKKKLSLQIELQANAISVTPINYQ